MHKRFTKYQQFLFQLLQQQAGLTFGNNETHKPSNILHKMPFMAVHQLHLDCGHGRMAADLHQGSTKGCFSLCLEGMKRVKIHMQMCYFTGVCMNGLKFLTISRQT
jgi:hypothetical protein